MTSTWKRIVVGLAVAAATGSGVAVPASASEGTRPTVLAQFTGHGVARKPPQALKIAETNARNQASAAGFTGCEIVDENVEFEPMQRIYDATVTLECSG